MTRGYVIQNLFRFPKEYDFGRIQVFRGTNRMVLMYICPKRNLKEKNLLRKKSRRIREFQASGLKSSMPSVE